MNMTTIALALLAWQLLSNNKQTDNSAQNPLETISQFVNDDTKNIINCVEKLSSNDCSQQDKTGAIFQMMTNPAIMNMASNLFGNKKEDEKPFTNDEGYKFEQPSKASQDFFKPIDNIADAEVKHKLYWFYDNWYVK